MSRSETYQAPAKSYRYIEQNPISRAAHTHKICATAPVVYNAQKKFVACARTSNSNCADRTVVHLDANAVKAAEIPRSPKSWVNLLFCVVQSWFWF